MRTGPECTGRKVNQLRLLHLSEQKTVLLARQSQQAEQARLSVPCHSYFGFNG